MLKADFTPGASTSDTNSFLSEAKTMAALDDLEKASQQDASRQAGPSMDTAVPTLEREPETSNGALEEEVKEKTRPLSSDSRETTNEDTNAAATHTVVVPGGAVYDFPDGGLRAWSVVIGVREHSHSSELSKLICPFLILQSCLLAASTCVPPLSAFPACPS